MENEWLGLHCTDELPRSGAEAAMDRNDSYQGRKVTNI